MELEARCQAVMVLAETELIFFIVAAMGLCFFVLEIVLIAQGCFS